MDEFIQMVTQQLGLSDATGKSATGRILKMLEDQLGSDLFAKVKAQLPGVQGLISASEKSGSSDESGGGLIGSLTSMAGSLLGGKAGELADLTSSLTKSGLSVDKIPQFMTMLIEFLKQKLGNDLFAAIAARLPELLGRK